MRILGFAFTAASLCSALVVPDQETLLDAFSEDSLQTERVESTDSIDHDLLVHSTLGLLRPDGSARDDIISQYCDQDDGTEGYSPLGDGCHCPYPHPNPGPGPDPYPGHPHRPHNPRPWPNPGHPGYPGPPSRPGHPKHPYPPGPPGRQPPGGCDPPWPPGPPGREPPPPGNPGNPPGEPCNPPWPGPPGQDPPPSPPPGTPPGTPPGEPCNPPWPPGPPGREPPPPPGNPGDPGTPPGEPCNPPWPGPPGREPPPPRNPGNPGNPPREPCNPPDLSNKTIWEMISQSPQTARLADLLRKQNDLVSLLNSTNANYTFFAPTNHAMDYLGASLELPSMESILSYHVVVGRHPFHKLRAVEHQTLATVLNESALGKRKSLSESKKKDKDKGKDGDKDKDKNKDKDKDKNKDKDKDKKKHTEYPQRLRVDVVQQSVLLNGASLVVKENIIATNGIIHYIDLPLTPPPNTSTLLRSLPEEFSTFTFALSRTDLESQFDTSSRRGGTTFVPTNNAFRTMGPVVNAYLFSPEGEECLRSILRYHILPGKTVYSDVVYGDQEDMDEFSEIEVYEKDKDAKWRPRRYPVVRVDAQTLLDGQGMNLHLRRREMVSKMRVNGFWEPRVVDVLAGDGVIHVLDRVLFPPKVAGKVTVKGREMVDEVGVMGTLRDLLEECRPKKKDLNKSRVEL